MKNNIIKISSLGLVALLASCGKNAATPLKKVDPDTAKAAAQSIAYNQLATKEIELSKNPEIEDNDLFYDDYFPYTMTSMSADITIRNTSKMQTTGLVTMEENEERIIKKHIYFDMKNLFYHAHISMTYTGSGSNLEKETYSDTDYYYFFIEDKEQDEEAAKTEYGKIGTYYALLNVGNLAKFTMEREGNQPKAYAATRLCDQFKEIYPIIKSSTFEFDIGEALSSTLISPTINWDVLQAIYKQVVGTDFTTSSNQMLIMNDWLGGSFDDVTANFDDFRSGMKDLEDENSYFDYAYRSNGATSLGIEADAHLGINQSSDESSTTGYIQEIASLTFRDLYLSESHFAVNREASTSTKLDDIEVTGYTYSSTSCDQYIKYNTSESDTYPSDYQEYTPGI